MHGGWHQVAFERDVRADITAVEWGGRPLMLVRRDGRIEAFRASCPHRGAHLGHGGVLDGDAVRCPFHAYRVGLSSRADAPFAVDPLPTLVVGGLVFVRDASYEDRGFEEHMRALDAASWIVPGFEMRVAVDAALVIENAFDAAHFRPVHAICNSPRFEVDETAGGALRARGEFELPPSQWRNTGAGNVRAPFEAIAYSPHLVVSTTGGERPYTTLTASIPTGERACIVRLSVAIPNAGEAPSRDDCLFLLRQSKAGLEKDQVIWEHLDLASPPRFTADDAAVVAFRRFCERARGAHA